MKLKPIRDNVLAIKGDFGDMETRAGLIIKSNIGKSEGITPRWFQIAAVGPEQKHLEPGMWVYVEDCDAVFNRAVEAGCEILEEMMDAFWGDRNGKVKDPFGHCWSIASHKWILTPEEMEKGLKEWEEGLKK